MTYLWPHYLNDANDTVRPAVTRNLSTKYLIIGAGITGLSAAHTLAMLHPDEDIIIVDKGPIAANASNNNAGFAMRISRFFGTWNEERRVAFDRNNRINEFGYQTLKNLTEKHLLAEHWYETGVIHAGQSAWALKNNAEYIRCLEQGDIAHEVWSKSMLSEKLGTDFYEQGIMVNNSCALIQPAALMRSLISTLSPNIQVYFDSEVSQLNADGTVVVNAHTIKADKVIIATNWQAIRTPFKRPYSFGLTLAGSLSRPLTNEQIAQLGTLKEWGILSSYPLGATVRLTSDNRIMMRNSISYNHNKPLNDRQLAAARSVHQDAINKRFGHLGIEIERSWTAIEGRTINETSYFDKLNERTFVSAIYNGSGITKGAALGTHIAYWASDIEGPIMTDITANFAPPKFVPKNRTLVSVGVNSLIKWRRRHLGND